MFSYSYSRLWVIVLLMALMTGNNSLTMEPSSESNLASNSLGLLEFPDELIQEILLSAVTPGNPQEDSASDEKKYKDSPIYGDTFAVMCRINMTSKLLQKKISNESIGKKLLAQGNGTIKVPPLYLAALLKSPELIALSKELAATSKTQFMAEIKNTYSVTLVDPQLSRRSSMLSFLEQSAPKPSNEGYGFILHTLLKREPNFRPTDGPGIRYIIEKKPILHPITITAAIDGYCSLELLCHLTEELYRNGYTLREHEKIKLLNEAVYTAKNSEAKRPLFYAIDTLIGDASCNLSDYAQASYNELKRLH